MITTSPSRAEILFVFNDVAEWQTLADAAPAGAEVVVLDGTGDGLAQIAAYLEAGAVSPTALHIVSHGQPGRLQLGSLSLDQEALAGHEAILARIGKALAEGGDILLYGCDVAAGEQGAIFVDSLSKITGVDIAASNNLTGNAAAGGDWILETRTGLVEAGSEWAQYSLFSKVLADQTINLGGALTSGSLVSGNFSIGGINIAVTSDSGFTITQQNGGLLFEETAEVGNFSVTITDPGANNQFSAKSIYIDNTSTGGEPGYGGYLSIKNTSATTSVPETQYTGNYSLYFSDNLQSNGNYYIGNSLVISDIEQNGYQVKTKFFIKDFVVDLAATNDSTPPQVASITRQTPAVSDTNADSLVFRVTFSETVSQIDPTDFTVSGSTATVTNVTAATANSYDVTVSGGNLAGYNGIITLGFAGGQDITDGAGNALVNTTPTGANSSSYAIDNISPVATSVTSAIANGTYKAGDVVGIQLNFSEAVTVAGGTPQLTLETGTTDRTINYASGSGTSTLTFTYTVQAGDTSADLDYTSTSALALNGSTLRDAAGNNATLTLPSPGAANSLGANKNIVIDGVPPTTTIASLTFSNDSGTSSTDFITNAASQTISGTLSANLAADETVKVSLDNGGSWVAATATVGQDTWSLAGVTLSASSTLKIKVSDTAGNDGSVLSQAYQYDITAPTTTFSNLSLSADTGASATDFITKTAAQTISATLSGALAGGDILYGSLDNGATWTDITSKVSGTALTWNGVTLTASNTLQLKVADAAGNESTPVAKAYTLDTTTPAASSKPVLASASDTGSSNSDGITSDNTPTLTGTAENGSTVTVFDGATLLGTVTAGAGGWTLTTGALAEGGHTITAVSTDTAGNASAASAALTVTIDTTAPDVTSVAVPANGTYYSGSALDFTANFSEAVVVDTSGGTPRIALVVGATTRYADYVSGSGSSALVFRYTVPSGDVDANGITIGALSVNGGTLRDAAGNSAATTLNSVGSTADVNVDGSNPSITNVSASTADGAYAAGSTVTITVDFSTAVDVDTAGGIPTLALDGGGSATYSGGSGSSTLTFVYTVGAGQNSADLDYSSTGALTLNGATIVDAGGSHQPAALTLATPGTAGSLGANKDLVIDTAAPTNTTASATFSADTGTSATDFITKTAAQTISGTLVSNLVAGEHVYVSLDNASTWVLAAASAGANTWSLSGQTLAGSGTLQVRVVDDAGNSGTAYTQAYVLDTMAPTISFSGIALSADTGVAGDLITNTAAQTISATLSGAPAAGDVVYGSLDNGATWTDVTSKVSGTTLTWNGVTLAGSNTLQLRVSDVAGNDGATTSAAYVLDTTAPTTTVASVVFSADTGVSSTDFITKTAAQTLSGTLSANLASGEYVLVSLDNGATWTAATSTVGSNTWSLGGQTLSASDTLQVKVSDTAGNDGAVFGQAYIYDTAATVPTVASLSSLTLAPVLTGVAALAAGETMTITVGGATYDVVPVAGAWSLDLAAAVPASGTLTLALNQRYEVVATVTDLAGNVASDTTAGELLLGTLPVTPDPEPPVTPPVTPPTPGVPDNDGVSNTVEDQTPSIPGPGGTTTPGDGNGDGIKDSEQAGVASIGFVLSPTGESNPGSAAPTFTTLVASSLDGKVSGDPSNSRITSLEQKDAPAHLPEGMQMPIGLVSFTIELGAGKTGENFSLYVDPALEANGYWKQDNTGTWVNIASEPYGGKMVMEGGRLRLDFHIEDGGQFDADGKVDGIITDPGAPGHMPLSIVGMAPDVGPGFWF